MSTSFRYLPGGQEKKERLKRRSCCRSPNAIAGVLVNNDRPVMEGSCLSWSAIYDLLSMFDKAMR